jgi:hypothetical protein
MELGILTGIIENYGIPASFAFMVFMVWYFTRKDANERDKRADELLKEQISLAKKQTDILEALKNSTTANTVLFSDGVLAIKTEIKDATHTITGKMDAQHTVILSQFSGILDKVTLLHNMFLEAKTAWQSEHEKTGLAMKSFEANFSTLQAEILTSIRKVISEEKTHEKVPNVNPNHRLFTDE